MQLETNNSFTPSMPAPRQIGVLQRKCSCGQHTVSGGECEDCNKKQSSQLQRATRNSQLETRDSEGAPPIVHEVLNSSGQPLDSPTRAFMEPRFGHDFSRVRVHTDSRAAESARAVNALAYTVGTDVVFRAGHYAPATLRGNRLLAHELTHVVQQARSKPVAQTALAVGAGNDGFEREADAFAHSVLFGPAPGVAPTTRSQPALQKDDGEGISLEIYRESPVERRRLKRELGIELPPGLPETNPADKCPTGYRLIERSTWFRCDESLGTKKLGCAFCTPQGQQCKCTEILNLLGHHRIIAPKSGKCGDDFRITLPKKGAPVLDVVKAEIPGGDTPLDIHRDVIPELGEDVATGRYDVCLKGPEGNDDKLSTCGGSKCPTPKSTPAKKG
ncbi:MAG: DUF4157 domain-containing protein [Acidobacteriota bacterium]